MKQPDDFDTDDERLQHLEQYPECLEHGWLEYLMAHAALHEAYQRYVNRGESSGTQTGRRVKAKMTYNKLRRESKYRQGDEEEREISAGASATIKLMQLEDGRRKTVTSSRHARGIAAAVADFTTPGMTFDEFRELLEKQEEFDIECARQGKAERYCVYISEDDDGTFIVQDPKTRGAPKRRIKMSTFRTEYFRKYRNR